MHRGVPLKVLFGSETFRDGVRHDERRVLSQAGGGTKLPTTSAPSPGEFAEVYARLQDYSGCISIHIGAQLSATAEAARSGAHRSRLSCEGCRQPRR